MDIRFIIRDKIVIRISSSCVAYEMNYKFAIEIKKIETPFEITSHHTQDNTHTRQHYYKPTPITFSEPLSRLLFKEFHHGCYHQG